MNHLSWNAALMAGFNHLRPEPEPRVTDQDAAEQFAADVTEAVTEIASDAGYWSLMITEGRRSMPALNASEREDLLTRLWAIAETMKQMRKGEI